MKPSAIPALLAALSAPAFAQPNDAPPVDARQMLQSLRQFKEQNETSLKARRDGAYRQIAAAAASNETAATFWTNAVLAVQFAGVDHQSAAVREWKQGEGEGLKAKEGANAARLHLVWLGLTMQNAAGAERSKLLPAVLDFVRQAEADEAAMEHLDEQIEKAKAGARGGAANKALSGETHAKKLHNSIMRMSVTGSPVAKMFQIGELLGGGGKKKQKGGGDDPAGGWEMVPGNVGGIYNSIVLPEFRATKDPRILNYWDRVIRKGQESIDPSMPDYEEKQWSQVKRPALLWARAQDMMQIGLHNRAITEMFAIIKGFPQHPEAANWIPHLEQLVSAQATPPAASAASSGAVAPPAAIPPATANPPTAVIAPPAAPNGR